MNTRTPLARWFRLAIALTALWAVPAWPQQPVDDVVARRKAMHEALDRVTEEFSKNMPEKALIRNDRGQVVGVNTNSHHYAKHQTDYRAEMYRVRQAHNVNDKRFDILTGAAREAGVPDGFANSGSKPKTIDSDVDFTETKPGSAKKLAKKLSDDGYHVKELSDRFIVAETDTVIWKKPPDHAPGSVLHREFARRQAWSDDTFPTAGGKYRTSGGAAGVLDPEGSVLANARKFVEGGGALNPQTQLDKINGHIVGKSVSKSAEWTGTKHRDPEFFRQADALRNHKTWEESGVCNVGDPPDVKAKKIQQFLDKATDHMTHAAEVGRAQSQVLDQTRAKTAESLSKQGLGKEAQVVRNKRLEASVTNEETMAYFAETNPKLAARLSGAKVRVNPDGTFTDLVTGRKISPSEFRRTVTVTARTKTVTVANSNITTGTGGKGMSKVQKIGFAMMLIGLFDATKTAAEKAGEEAQPGDSTAKSVAKVTAYTLWELTGIPAAFWAMKAEGMAEIDEFKKARAEGKDPSLIKATARATLWGFIGLGKMILDPIIKPGEAVWHGVGLAMDERAASQATAEAEEMMKTVAKLKAMLAQRKAELDRVRVVVTPPAVPNGVPGQSVKLQARVENLPDWIKGFKYVWTFSDDQLEFGRTVAEAKASDPFGVTHTFHKEGVYEVRLVLYDVERALPWAVGHAEVPVLIGPPPTEMALTPPITVSTTGGRVPFDVRVAAPPKEPEFEWDFGDGLGPSTTEETTCAHEFKAKGEYVVTVRLTDKATGKAVATARGRAVIEEPEKPKEKEKPPEGMELVVERQYHDAAKSKPSREERGYRKIGDKTPISKLPHTATAWYEDGTLAGRWTYIRHPEYPLDVVQDGPCVEATREEPRGNRLGFTTVQEGQYKLGKEVGLWKCRKTLSNGVPSTEFTRMYGTDRDTNRLFEGRFVEYFEPKDHADTTPRVKVEGQYTNGLKEGTWRWYWHDHAKKPDYGLSNEANFAKGKLEGFEKDYSEKTGKLQRETEWRGGNKNGREALYDDSGEIREDRHYLDDERHGKHTIYGARKKPVMVEEYVKDKSVKRMTYRYHPGDGHLERIMTVWPSSDPWGKGRSEVKEFDKDGNPK